jgi:hypothetical protein
MNDRWRPRELRDRLAGAARRLRHLATRGRSHFERVESVPYRATVSGVRGKSTVVEWFNEALVERGLETYAKETGNHAVSYHGTDSVEIERGDVTRLYENERELAKFWPVDAIVAENQGIREYTTRYANVLFDPQVVILTNVRRDHQSTLGGTLSDIARVFTRSVPAGAHVVSGDRNEAVNDYLRREFEKQGISFSVAKPGSDDPYDDVFGVRSALVVDEALRVLGLDPLDPAEIRARTTELRSGWRWRRLEGGGRVHNGAMMNDVESTELLRQHLVEELDDPTTTLCAYLRRDRAGRTAAFVEYTNWLSSHGLVDRVHAVGPHARMFQRKVDRDVVHHDETTTSAGAVLDDCLEGGVPVYVVGNTVADFMREFESEIESRAVE